MTYNQCSQYLENFTISIYLFRDYRYIKNFIFMHTGRLQSYGNCKGTYSSETFLFCIFQLIYVL